MGALILFGQLLLAGVFATAALAKFADRAGSRQALREFGLREALVPAVAAGLPAAELAVAVALLVPATAGLGALGALVLLLCFTVAIAGTLRRGQTADCHCFGRLHSAPTGWSTLARTAALALFAGLVAAALQRHSGPGPLDWASAFSAGEAALLLLGVCLVVFLFGAGALFVHLLAENERLAARVDALEAQPGAITNDQTGGLPVGAPAPPFTLPSLDGRSVSLAQLQAPGKPIIVVFSDINCGPCRALQPELEAWQHDHGARLTLAVVSRGTASAHSTGADAGGGPPLLLQHDREVADAYQAPATPTAVLVRPDGTIGSQPALGAHAIATLVANTAAVAAPRRLPAPRTTVAASASTASAG